MGRNDNANRSSGIQHISELDNTQQIRIDGQIDERTVATKRLLLFIQFLFSVLSSLVFIFLCAVATVALLLSLAHISLCSCCYTSMVFISMKLCKTISNVDKTSFHIHFTKVLLNGVLFYRYPSHTKKITLGPKANEGMEWAK